MKDLHNDNTNLKPEETKTFSEGAGKLMSALGKEIDEHDVGGKLANAGAFAIKAKAIYKIITAIVGVIILLLFLIPVVLSIFAK